MSQQMLDAARWCADDYSARESIVDDVVAAMAAELNVNFHSSSPVVAEDPYQRLGYLESLPSVPFVVDSYDPNAFHLPGRHILRPALCVETLLFLSDLEKGTGVLPSATGLHVFGSRGMCFRAEGIAQVGDPLRMPAFEMQELVFAGSATPVEVHAQATFRRLEEWLKARGVDCSTEVASDHFYGRDATRRRRIHRALEQKVELRVPWGNGDFVAVASMNLHGGRLMETLAGRVDSFSACVAFGIDRLFVAVMAAAAGVSPMAFYGNTRAVGSNSDTTNPSKT